MLPLNFLSGYAIKQVRAISIVMNKMSFLSHANLQMVEKTQIIFEFELSEE